MTDKRNNLDIQTFKEIVRAGVIIAKANPDKDVDTLVKAVVNELVNQILGNV